MAYTGSLQTDPLSLPNTVDPAGSLVELNPLPPPGRPVDGTADLHPATWGHLPVVNHEIEILLGGTITTGQDWTFTFTPISMITGLPIADALGAVTLSVEVGGTQTATALGDLVVVAFTAAQTITTVAEVDTVTRISEIISDISNAAGTLTAISAESGQIFEVSSVPEAGGTAVDTITVDATGSDLRMGVFVVRDGTHEDGRTPIVRPPAAGDTADMLFGVVADGNRGRPIDSETGYFARFYKPGRNIPILRIEGHYTAFCESAVVVATDTYVRMDATGTEVAGAATDTPSAAVYTTTPTVLDTTVYAGLVQVFDASGGTVATSPFSFTSGGGALDTEIVTGLLADLNGSAADDFVAFSGTTTLITTTTSAGHTVSIVSTGAGVLTTVTTTAAKHVRLRNHGKFSRGILAAGTCAIEHE